MKIYSFEELNIDTPLIVDAIYAGGSRGNAGDDPISKILPVGNQGGFRKSVKGKIPFCVLYTSGEDMDWPDTFDLERGLFTYYGDNKKSGKLLSEPDGNKLLENTFNELHQENRKAIFPFLVFEKSITKTSNRSVRFRGLVVPGHPSISQTNDLVAIWKHQNGTRYQNYIAIFSILNLQQVSKKWLIDGNLNEIPEQWSNWISGKKTLLLESSPIRRFRKKDEQIPINPNALNMLHNIRDFFRGNDFKFEPFAAYLFELSDSNVKTEYITRGSVDGGRDALGFLTLGPKDDPIKLSFALEAKCYTPGRSVGVKGTSRLISRLKHREFGVIVTTSFVGEQAYKEIRDDRHPVIVISGKDIIDILTNHGIKNLIELNKLLVQFG